MISTLYDQVLEWIPEKSRVLDLGTGDGQFLDRLIKAKNVVGEGVELDPEKVTRCIERGLVVHQGNIMDGLDQYGLAAFDYVLMLGTFQELSDPVEVTQEAFRVGRHVILSYSNFAHWRVRFQVLFTGRTPITRSLPEPWYRTQNVNFFSVLDFKDFCDDTHLQLVKVACFNAGGKVSILPNLLGEEVLCLLTMNGRK